LLLEFSDSFAIACAKKSQPRAKINEILELLKETDEFAVWA
jgi:hypothetical protein